MIEWSSPSISAAPSGALGLARYGGDDSHRYACCPVRPRAPGVAHVAWSDSEGEALAEGVAFSEDDPPAKLGQMLVGGPEVKERRKAGNPEGNAMIAS